MNTFSPWVEKYRPSSLSDVVLDDTNKQILNNILTKNIFQIYYFMVHPEQAKRLLLLI